MWLKSQEEYIHSSGFVSQPLSDERYEFWGGHSLQQSPITVCFLDFELYKSEDIFLVVIDIDVDIRVLLQPKDYVDIVSTGYQDLHKVSRPFQQNI